MHLEFKAEYLQTQDGTKLRMGAFPVDMPKAALILLTGRTEFIEKYARVIEAWQARGFSVFTKDWRNQGLSDRPLDDPHKHHVVDFGVMLADLDHFLDAIRPRLRGLPVFLFGHSMGGHMVLRHLAERQGDVAGAVVCAPMVDIRYGMPAWVARALATAGTTLGLGEAYAPGQGPAKSGKEREKVAQALTSDQDALREEWAFLDDNPDHDLGGITFAWLKAAMASIQTLQSPGYVEHIQTPVLCTQAGADIIVDNDAMTALAARIPPAHLVRVENAQHELWREAEPMRDQFWNAIDAFLADWGLAIE